MLFSVRSVQYVAEPDNRPGSQSASPWYVDSVILTHKERGQKNVFVCEREKVYGTANVKMSNVVQIKLNCFSSQQHKHSQGHILKTWLFYFLRN